MSLKIGIQGPFLPPFDDVIKTVKKIESQGYDSVWWPDHLMGFIPESIWTPNLIELANYRESPHIFLEIFVTMSVAACNTSKIYIGSCVTEILRRHPAVIAQAALTLEHLSKNRVILGIGAGEIENVEPYGISYEKAVSKLREAVCIIKKLWTNKKIDYDGEFWKLKDAILALPPYNNLYPPIWIAAHYPKLLKATGELGDGWLPHALDPTEYREKLKIIYDAAQRAERDISDITPALFFPTIVDEDHENCHKMFNSTAAKTFAFFASPEKYAKLGYSHPLRSNPFTNFIPTRWNCENTLEILQDVPEEICEHYYLHGAADEVIERLEKYQKIGLEHVIFWNLTPVCNYRKTRASFHILSKVVEYFKSF